MLRRAIYAAAMLIGLLAPALSQAPPAVPALPDTQRLTAYSISASLCDCAVGFALYGDGTDADNWIQVYLNGTRILSTDPAHGWFLSSATGPIGAIPLPITDAFLNFSVPQTGTVQIVGARRPRRLSQFPENRGITARDFNEALTDIVAQNRENWDKVNGLTTGAMPLTVGVTPITGGINSYCLSDNAGLLGVVNCSFGLIVGSTTVTGGSSNAILFNSGGVLGANFLGGSGTQCVQVNNAGALTVSGGGPCGSSSPITISGLAITRAQIPTTNTGGAQSLTLVGYSTANDLGFGAPYSCSGQSSSSLLAIQDAVGTWCALSLGPGIPINIGWFGATGNGSTDDAPAIQAAIDALNGQQQQSIFCPAGVYRTTIPIFLEQPAGLRGADGTHGNTWNIGAYYALSETVNYLGVAYISLQNLNLSNQPDISPTWWRKFAWAVGTTYALNDVVSYRGVPWKSLSNANTGHTPPAVDAAAWNSGTTYSSGQMVNWGGSVYESIQNANLNNNPNTSPTFWKIWWTQWWTQNSNSGAFGYSFIGPPTGYFNLGCVIEPTYQNGVWLQLGAGNGMIVKNINLSYTGHGTSLYNGQEPTNGVGICIPGDGAGSNRATLEQIVITGVFTGVQTSCNVNVGNGGSLGAENTLRKVAVFNCVVYFSTLGTQNFVNTIEEGSSGCLDGPTVQTGVQANIHGGNYSVTNEQTVSNTFTTSGTSGLTVTGCGGGPCTYQLTTTIVSSSGGTGGAGPSTGPDSFITNCPVGSEGCVYNSWTILLPHYGLVPLTLVSYNRGTNVATFQFWPQWNIYYYHFTDATTVSDISTEVAAVTQFYGTERGTTFTGGALDISDIHVENAACTTFLFNNSSGGDSGSRVRRIFFNVNPSLDNYGPANGGGPGNPSFPQYVCAQSFPFLNITNASVTFESIRWSVDRGNSSVIIDLAGLSSECRFDSYGSQLWNPAIRTGFQNSPSVYSTPNGACNWTTSPWMPGSYNTYQYINSMSPAMGFYPASYGGVRLPIALYSTLSAALPASVGDTYPAISGQTIYSVLDITCVSCSPSTPAKWVQSAHLGYSWGQNLTTGNVTGLSWSNKGGSCVVLANANLFNVIFPGLGITLANGVGGATTHYIITGIQPWTSLDGGTHRGYFTIVGTNGNCGAGTSGTTYTGTTIGQDSFNWNNVQLASVAPPALSACGTSPAVSAGSNAQSGSFTTGSSGTPTACTVVFAAAYPNQAFCSISAANAAANGVTGGTYISAQNASAFTVTLGTGTNSAKYNYTCQGS
jgi:hypothetical protein